MKIWLLVVVLVGAAVAFGPSWTEALEARPEKEPVNAFAILMARQHAKENAFGEVIDEQLSMSNTKKTEVSKAKDFMMFVKVHYGLRHYSI